MQVMEFHDGYGIPWLWDEMVVTTCLLLYLFAALTNAVCLYNASFFAIDFCKCFLFSCFIFVY